LDPHDPNVLAAFVEDRLDPDERQSVAAHLAGCAECRRMLALVAKGMGAPAIQRRDVAAGRWRQSTAWLGAAATIAIATVAAAIVLWPHAVDAPSPVQPSATGETRVDGKPFSLEAGTWMDASFDPLAGLPAVDVTTAADRTRILQEHPGLTPFAALGPRVTVVFRGSVYRFDVK
jgi:putative zinc finger protein